MMISSLKSKLKNFFRSLKILSKKDKALIANLRSDIKNAERKIVSSADYWESNRKQLVNKIIHSNPQNFLEWQMIKDTMFFPGHEAELNKLKAHPDWKIIQAAIKEDKIGSPAPYSLYTKSSGNLIHHAYSLYEYLARTNIKIKDIKLIFEFGGGYGSLCRLLYKLGYEGTYMIYDLPEFLALQKYFLLSLGLPIKVSPNPLDRSPNTVIQISELNFSVHADLFIGLWSLSEVPLKLRGEILNHVQSDSFLIAYQSEFSGVNNVNYFKEFYSLRNKLWDNYEINHLAGNNYLIGT